MYTRDITSNNRPNHSEVHVGHCSDGREHIRSSIAQFQDRDSLPSVTPKPCASSRSNENEISSTRGEDLSHMEGGSERELWSVDDDDDDDVQRHRATDAAGRPTQRAPDKSMTRHMCPARRTAPPTASPASINRERESKQESEWMSESDIE